jgi:hypothetical protein
MSGGDGDDIRNSDMATQMWYDELHDPGYNFDEHGFDSGTGHFT